MSHYEIVPGDRKLSLCVGQGLLVRYWSCTGSAAAGTAVTTLLSDVLMFCVPDFMWEGSETVTCKMRSRLTDRLTT